MNLISEHQPPDSSVFPVETKCNLSPPFFYTTFFLQTASFLSVSTSVSTSLMVSITSQLPPNAESRKWKYDLGISNLKLQFKDLSLFFFLS